MSTAQREEDLFDAARKMSTAAARSEFLDGNCGGDAALRARVEGLLTAATDAERFFDEGGSVMISQEVAAHFTRTLRAAAGSVSAPGEEPIGTRIGRYKLVEKIGEGGCGVVYLADQEEPVRRRVALKIIKLGMETKSVIARFEAERQALAMMDHPNIARVYDAGATDRGPPYFVMELVHGVRITEFCDKNRLTLRARLDLFVLICHAIQHAHQKGIIHGDIKPSNVMVALQDEVPVPKVIDFGISKATEARLTDKVLFTTYAQLIGTPAYMSPEQAQMGGVDVDTRSDIYSLGVLLYELLTGRTPFDPKELMKSGLDEMRRLLREKDPVRPSARLSGLPRDELDKAAEALQVDPSRLVSLLKGDLDWIVMKSMEKDRRRRYETANSLAMDIERYLDHEAIEARPPSWVYRLQKLVRRNRVVFIAGSAVAVALVAGMGTSTWLFLKERDARQRAVAAEQQQAHLRHDAETREKITLASLLVSQEKFEEADKILNEVSLADPTVEGAAVLRAIGEWRAIHEQWKPAASRFAQLLQVNQLDGWDVASLDFLRLGPALVEMGDASGYERFRLDAIARFIGSVCPFPDRIVKISLLQPANEQVIASLSAVAEATAKLVAASDAGGDPFQAAWHSVSLALFEYRRSNYAEAEIWCRRCLAYPEYNAPRAATAHVILAMTCNQLNRAGEARTELAAGREIIEGKYKGQIDRGTPVQGFWFDWAFARILLREAAARAETPARSSNR
jgi:serine/threonine protein kinase